MFKKVCTANDESMTYRKRRELSPVIVTLSLFLFCFVILCLVIPGCGGTYRATRPSRPALEDTEQVVYKNLDLKASVGVLDISQDTVNGLVRARCRLKNLTGKTINAEIKIKFRDAQGYEMDDAAPWTPLPLESGEIKSFEQIASDPNAVDFRIVIQRAGSH
jgi:uncharacterized protein YcfL